MKRAIRADVFVEDRINLIGAQFFYRDIVFDAPVCNVSLKERHVAENVLSEWGEDFIEQRRLIFEAVAVPLPTLERKHGVGHGARVAEEQDDWDGRIVRAYPSKHKIGADELDQAISSNVAPVVLITPYTPDATGQNIVDGLGEIGVLAIGSEPLAPFEMIDKRNMAGG